LRILQETGSLDRLWEAGDHTHRSAVISAVEEVVCDYQFVFSILDELCVSHHA